MASATLSSAGALLSQVYNYAYLLDPKIAAHVSHELKQENIVVFDEAHNIGEWAPTSSFSVCDGFPIAAQSSRRGSDNVCIESLSVHVDEHRLRNCARNLKRLDDKVKEFVDFFSVPPLENPSIVLVLTQSMDLWFPPLFLL